MAMFKDVLETVRMIEKGRLDIRTITMGISLLDCIDSSGAKSRQKIYEKITRLAENLVKEGERIENELGIPIVNKRIPVTPISLIAGSSDDLNYVEYAKTLDAAAATVRQWRFVPARRGDEPISATVLVPIVFRLEAAS